MGLPSDAIPVSEINQSGNSKLPPDAIPVSQMKDSPIDASNMFGQAPPSPEGNSPLNIVQRAQLSIPSQIDSKIDLLKQMGFSDVEKTSDGRLKVHGRYVDPRPNGIVSFIKDLGGDLADMVGPSIPVVGQIVADAMAVAGAPETGGASLLGLAGANAAGAAVGEAVRQKIANQMTGQPYSGGEMAMQAGLGAATPYIGAGISAGLKGTLKAIAPAIKGITEKLGDTAPSVLKALSNIDESATQHYIAETRAGRAGTDILNETNAHPDRQLNLAQRTLFGDPNAVGTPQELHSQYKRLLSGVKNPSTDVPIIDEAMRHYFPGLSKDTLDVMKKYGPQELLDKSLTSISSYNDTAQNIIASLKNTEKALGNKFDIATAAIADPSSTIGRRQIEVGDILSNMMKSLDINTPSGVGIIDNGLINTGYASKTARELYSDVIGKIETALGKTPMSSIKIGGKAIPQELAAKIASQGPQGSSSIKLSVMRRLTKEMQPLLDRAFNTLDAKEATPLAGFMKELRGRMAYAYKPLAELNERWGNLQNAKQVFSDISNGFKGQKAVENVMKAALNDDTTKLAIQKLDGMITGTKILPKIQKLGAAQEIKALNVDKGLKTFVSDMKGILSRDPSKALPNEILGRLDNAIGQKIYRFGTDAKDAITAQEFTGSKSNIYKQRALYFILGGGGIFRLNPALGAAGLLGTVAASRPASVQSMLLGADALKQSIGEGARTIGETAGSVSGQKGRAVLAGLLRSKKA